MLLQALRLIERGQATTVEELAAQLGLSPALGKQLVADLVRLGYLQPLAAPCPGQCTGCSQEGACSLGFLSWAITPKGQRALNSQAEAH
jgi:hypothetical protein